MAATLDRAPRVSRRARLAAVVEKLVDSWSRGVEALDVGDVFAEYLELRPDDAPKLEALAAREARQGAAALRRYFEAQLADATVAAELDRLDGLDAAPQTRPRDRRVPPRAARPPGRPRAGRAPRAGSSAASRPATSSATRASATRSACATGSAPSASASRRAAPSSRGCARTPKGPPRLLGAGI